MINVPRLVHPLGICNYHTTMNIKELIEELQKQDPEMMVVIDGYEGGYQTVELIDEIRLNLNVGKRGLFGEHKKDPQGEARAILIG